MWPFFSRLLRLYRFASALGLPTTTLILVWKIYHRSLSGIRLWILHEESRQTLMEPAATLGSMAAHSGGAGYRRSPYVFIEIRRISTCSAIRRFVAGGHLFRCMSVIEV